MLFGMHFWTWVNALKIHFFITTLNQKTILGILTCDIIGLVKKVCTVSQKDDCVYDQIDNYYDTFIAQFEKLFKFLRKLPEKLAIFYLSSLLKILFKLTD